MNMKPGGAILCFHGLAGSDEADVSGLHVEAEELRAVVAMARGIGEIVPLRELVDRRVLAILAVPFGLADLRIVRIARSLGLNCSLGCAEPHWPGTETTRSSSGSA